MGLRGARPAQIDVGNAGTLLRLLPGWLAGQPQGSPWTLDGDASIRKRPVDRIAEAAAPDGRPPRQPSQERLPPLEVEGAPLGGIAAELPVASAQVKSCLLFAGLVAEGETRRESSRCRPATTPSACYAAAGATVEPRGATPS